MSLEQAITDHAAAIRELAAAIKSAYQAGATISAVSAVGALTTTIEQDVTKVETDAKAEQKKVMAQVEADRKPSTAKEAVADALADALAAAKADKEAAAKKAESETATQNAQSQGAGQDSDDPLDTPAEIDYETDIKPRLIMLGKDKSALVALLGKYNAKKGTDIAKSDYAAIYHEAGDLIAARG